MNSVEKSHNNSGFFNCASPISKECQKSVEVNNTDKIIEKSKQGSCIEEKKENSIKQVPKIINDSRPELSQSKINESKAFENVNSFESKKYIFGSSDNKIVNAHPFVPASKK